MNRSTVVLLAVMLVAADKPKPKEPCQDLIYCEQSDDKELKRLVKTLLDSNQPAERIKVANIFRGRGPDAAIVTPALVKAMASASSPSVRQACSEALEDVNPALRKHVERLCFDADSGVRQRGIQAIRELRLDGKAATPAFWFRYTHADTQSGEAASLLEAIVDACRDDEFVADHLVRLATKGDRRRLQFVAVSKLPTMYVGDRAEMVKSIQAALRSAKETTQVIICIEALAKFDADAKPALPELRRLKGSTSETIRNVATVAVEKIENAKPPQSVSK